MAPSLVHDGAIFEAVTEVAADKRASVPARALSLRTLIMYESPSYDIGYEDVIGTSPSGAGCHLVHRRPHPVLIGAPLPADYLEQSRVLAQQIAADASEPPEVRSAAGCVLKGLERLKP